MGYTLLDTSTRGDTSKDHTMRISVMKARNPSKSYLDRAYSAVVDACDQIMNRQGSHGMDIPGYKVRKYDTDKAIDCTDKFQSGNNWLDNNNFGEGHYTWVYGCGNSDASEARNSGGWEKRTQGFVSTDWYPDTHYFSVMAIQESFHPFILNSCAYVQDHTNGNNEHSLGQDIYQNGSNNASPMAASYEDNSNYNYESKGECDRDRTTDGVTWALTHCTVKSMQDSRSHAYHNGVH